MIKICKNKTLNQKRVDTFDRQVKTLCDLGYPEAVGIERCEFIPYVSPLRGKFEIGDLIVIPKRFITLHKQMLMTKVNNKAGYAIFNLNLLLDDDVTPRMPYLIRDVDDGAATIGISFKSCVEDFNKQKRFGLSAEEGNALIIHSPEVLNHHFINLLGTNYQYGQNRILCLWLEGGHPCLSCSWFDYGTAEWEANPKVKWGFASCGSRILG